MKIKINKNIAWAILGQAIFAIFIIVALYGVGFATRGLTYRGLTPAGLRNQNTLGGYTTVRVGQIYALSISGIVITFVTIILPFVTLIFSNGKHNFFIGWSAIFLDIVSLALILASISIWADDLTIYSEIEYAPGYLAGQFVLTFVGALAAFCGIAYSYKKDLIKFN